ncbi:hypothetical protein [Micromonospora halophytica]|uniref:Uncharacterized protein n=1 Tax=Micromonospora halophytica TaxID=47864 RepID=A0A1C5GJ45_9ACTN|nr:hypothetical protein [Micromonospora halophytica]SCG33816.1 hypothetical protein GA0070560_10137 [Micromonospora halophytica]
MQRYGFSILTLLMELPTVAVLVTALVLAATRRDRLPRRARVLLSYGTLVLLGAGLVSLLWSLAFPHVVGTDWMREDGYQRIRMISYLVTAVTSVGYPIGIGLLVGAVFAGRRPTAAPANPWGSWTPSASAAVPSATPGAAGPTPPTTQWGATDLPSPAPDRD